MIIRGPFTIKWGDNEIADIETIKVEHKIESTDLQTIGGKVIEVDGPYMATAVIMLLATDIAALAAVLPQHFKGDTEILSTGETVNDSHGAIDVAPAACDTDPIYNDLEIISCGNPAQVIRIVHCRTKIDSVDVDNKLQKVGIKFVGESAEDEATIQFFRNGNIAVVS